MALCFSLTAADWRNQSHFVTLLDKVLVVAELIIDRDP